MKKKNKEEAKEMPSKERVIEIWIHYCQLARDIGLEAIDELYPEMPISPPALMDHISNVIDDTVAVAAGIKKKDRHEF